MTNISNKQARDLLASIIDGSVTDVTDAQFLAVSSIAADAAIAGRSSWAATVRIATTSQLRMQRICDLIAAAENGQDSLYAGAREAAKRHLGESQGWTIAKRAGSFVPVEYDGAAALAKANKAAAAREERERLQAEAEAVMAAATDRLDAALVRSVELLGISLPAETSRAAMAEAIATALESLASTDEDQASADDALEAQAAVEAMDAETLAETLAA